MKEKLVFLVSFNMYKGGSLAIYENIKKFIRLDKNLINITFNNKFKFDFNSKIEFKYPLKKFNIFYRLTIEQIFVFLYALFKKPELIVLLGNFPCLFWRGKQKVLFHNLLYLECLKNPRKFGIKLFCESKFWETCIRIVRPKIIVQTKYIKTTLIDFFNSPDLDIEILGAPIINYEGIINNKNISSYSNIKINNSFLNLFYPADFYPHKNHKFLFFCADIFLKYEMKVHLTIDEKLFKNIPNKEVFIFHKKISKKDINYLYKNTNALIYPSLIESLGMPLLEVTEYQKSIIAINMPYVGSAISDYYIFQQNRFSLDMVLNKFKKDYLDGKNNIAKRNTNIDAKIFYEKLIK